MSPFVKAAARRAEHFGRQRRDPRENIVPDIEVRRRGTPSQSAGVDVVITIPGGRCGRNLGGTFTNGVCTAVDPTSIRRKAATFHGIRDRRLNGRRSSDDAIAPDVRSPGAGVASLEAHQEVRLHPPGHRGLGHRSHPISPFARRRTAKAGRHLEQLRVVSRRGLAAGPRVHSEQPAGARTVPRGPRVLADSGISTIRLHARPQRSELRD